MILCGAAAGAVPDQPLLEPPPLVVSVELHLPPGTDPSGLAQLVPIRHGAPLSRRDVRRAIERLYASGRFGNIVLLEREVPGGVEVIIDVELRTFIDRVEIQGNRALAVNVLRPALGLSERRAEYYPELVDRLAERLKNAYRRVGYTETRIEHKLVRSALGESVLRLQIQEGAPTRIASISAAGDPQMPIEEIFKTLGLKPGDVLDLEKLERGFEAVKGRYRAEGHYRARFDSPEVSQNPLGAVVRLPIAAGPTFTLVFRGNQAFSDAELLKRLAYDGEEPLDEALAAQLADKIAAFYRLMGFADAKVSAREVRSSDRANARMVFSIEEGEPLRVTSIDFVGNSHYTSVFLRDRVEESLEEAAPALAEPSPVGELFVGGAQPRSADRPTIEATTVWVDWVYLQALQRICDLYRADGYLGVIAEAPLVERDERRREARVTLKLHEGVQTLITEVSFPGAPNHGQLASLVPVKKGVPLKAADIEASRQIIQRILGREGRIFAHVAPDVGLSADHREASVTFRISFRALEGANKLGPGPRVRVGRIMVEGLSRTHEEVVRSALAVEEASLLDPEAMAQSQRNLAKLGIFRNVSIRTSAPEVLEESKDVYVVVEERNTQSYSLGGGYSFADGPRAFFEYSKINLFGEVLQFQARAKVNYLDWNYDVLTHPKNRRDSLDALGRRINLSLQYPRFLSLLPTEIGAHLDLVHEQLSRAGAYDFQRSAAILGTDLMGQHGFSASLQYELETDRIGIDKTATEAQLSASDVARLRFDEGTINLHSIRSILSFDRRDDPTDPHRGFQVNVSGEVAQSLGGSVKAPSGANERPFALFAKASAQASAYLPLWRSVVLALSLKGGKIFPLDDRSRTPGPRRFFLGGASSIRGFPEDGLVPADVRETLDEEVRECNSAPDECISESAKRLREGKPYNSLGGELFALGRAELRVPIRRQIETALFIDVGNLWLDQTKVQLLKLRYSAGVGIRVITPIGPAAIDLGFNLAPDALINESTFEPHFSIGLF